METDTLQVQSITWC